jgi:hydroxylamine reductase
MYCHHCAQTSEGLYCDKVSTCGKTPELSNLQALLLQQNQSIARYLTLLANTKDFDSLPIARFLLDTTFSTLTNVNFDESQAIGYIEKLAEIQSNLKQKCNELKIEVPVSLSNTNIAFKDDMGYLRNIGKQYGVWARYEQEKNPDTFSLREFLRYGLKGVSAYFCHAERARGHVISTKGQGNQRKRGH